MTAIQKPAPEKQKIHIHQRGHHHIDVKPVQARLVVGKVRRSPTRCPGTGAAASLWDYFRI
ncbi:hypothetical protein [Marinobacter sp.]|uniref:hypothetical protein n=1 Tax=Marinobacter sp. TaxID=50741 RepID=UPI003A8E7B44